jgi:hypothetical protein
MHIRLETMHSIYVESLEGEPGFGRKLIHALQELGRWEFTDDRATADAVMQARGADAEDGFVADLQFRDQTGAVLWSGHAVRPHGVSGPMAYERIVAELQAALITEEHSRTA